LKFIFDKVARVRFLFSFAPPLPHSRFFIFIIPTQVVAMLIFAPRAARALF